MDDGIGIRPLRETDAEAVVALYARAANVEPRLGPITLAQWQRFTKLPQNHGGRDFRIAEQDGHPVGVAESSLRIQGDIPSRFIKIVVAPEIRRQRIGLRLFDELLAIDGQASDVSLQALVNPEWQAGVAFVTSLGFTHVESEIDMKCVSLIAPAATGSTAGIERVRDATAYATEVARIHNAAYGGEAGFTPHSPAEMATVLAEYELWIALEAGRLAGFCMAEPEPDLVWIESIAVDPVRQAAGIGTALAWRALEANGISADHPGWLNVSSTNAPALAIYRRLGFQPAHETRRFAAPRSDIVASRGRNFR
jgi:ribosomal protein S18 acetylase RimI-like enzyme